MKKIFLGLMITAATMVACSTRSPKSAESQSKTNDTMASHYSETKNPTTTSLVAVNGSSQIKEIVSTYLKLKNALSEDNAVNAAVAGAKLDTLFKNFDKTHLSDTQKKTFEDISDDARENGEHIGKNAGKIAHQREHFVLLSKDIYDLVKAFGAGQILFKDFDSMADNGKGAFWLSETKEIRNPYMGKAMLTSGSIQEEIK